MTSLNEIQFFLKIKISSYGFVVIFWMVNIFGVNLWASKLAGNG